MVCYRLPIESAICDHGQENAEISEGLPSSRVTFNLSDLFFDLNPTALIVGVICWAVLILLYNRWRERHQPRADEVLARDTRKPVLYLRPFSEDAVTFSGFDDRTYDGKLRAEPLILEPFKILGPLVAIGRPGEDMPPWGGAARLYAGDDWQSRFQELLDQAQLAVLFAGTSRNCLWELGQVFRHRPFVPAVLLLPARRQAWEAFRMLFPSATGLELPETGGTTRLIYFPTWDQPVQFADTEDGDDLLLKKHNPYLGALTRVVELIRPGSAAPWVKRARRDKSAEISGRVIGGLIAIIICVIAMMKSC